MAFGTGTHETTQLCLEALENYLPAGKTCIDVGTGSGILAIAAVKLGARKVVACDIDLVALDIATENGNRNGCGSRICWVAGNIDQIQRCRSGCLVANLTVEIIEQEFDSILARLQPGSVMILSGLLNQQVRRIERLRRRYPLEMKARTVKGEWACLVYKMKSTRRRPQTRPVRSAKGAR
jgi:ribosomal protein L11 methyltransferase